MGLQNQQLQSWLKVVIKVLNCLNDFTIFREQPLF